MTHSYGTNCYYTLDVNLVDAVGMTWTITVPVEARDNTPEKSIIDTAKSEARKQAGYAQDIAKPVSVTGVKFVF